MRLSRLLLAALVVVTASCGEIIAATSIKKETAELETSNAQTETFTVKQGNTTKWPEDSSSISSSTSVSSEGSVANDYTQFSTDETEERAAIGMTLFEALKVALKNPKLFLKKFKAARAETASKKPQASKDFGTNAFLDI